MMFLFVSTSVCVRLPSDSTSQWTPLSFTNSSYYQTCNELTPSRCYPCRAHLKKRCTFTHEVNRFLRLCNYRPKVYNPS
ncbi:hypothetical protein F9633_12010, partial [Staphylococcus pseudintermedius]|nr:hypothetical protein [Staphylococcus pseudintermedius]